MAGRLKGDRGPGASPPPRPARSVLLRAAVPLLTLAVLIGHLVLLAGARDWHDRWLPQTPEPERLQAAFVRELAPAAPPPRPTPPRPDEPIGVPETPPPRLRAPGSEGIAPLAPEPAASEPLPPVAALEPIAPLPELAASDAVGTWQPGLEWPLSTELHYRLTGDYRGAVHGQARVQWLREGDRYQVHLEAWIGPSVAPFMTRRLSSHGLITPNGLAPQRFDEVTGGLAGGGRQRTLMFDRGGVRLPDGSREPVADDTQDAASQFVQMTWLFLTGRHRAQPDWQVPIPLALPRNVHLWRYLVRDLTPVPTPMGDIPAWHIDSDMTETRGDMQAELWLAPSLQYLPVRIRIWQNRAADPRTHIDLVLSRPPLQAMPAEGGAPL